MNKYNKSMPDDSRGMCEVLSSRFYTTNPEAGLQVNTVVADGSSSVAKTETHRRTKSVSPLARVVMTQAVLRRSRGELTKATFEAKLQRLQREELEPYGLTLLVRNLVDGRVRLLVKDVIKGVVCDMMDFADDGKLLEKSGA